MSRLEKLLGGMVIKADEDYLSEISKLESKSYLAEAISLREKVKERARRKPHGIGLPFSPPGKSLLRSVPGRWTVWSGLSFHGKTNFVRFLMTHAMREGEKVLFISLEEDVEELVMEFCAVLLTTRQMTDQMIDQCCDWLDEKLWVFTHSGFIDPDIVVGAIIYAAKEFGVTHAVIDSLMMLSIRKDDYEGQKDLAMLLNRVCKQYLIHIHILAHPRKGENSHNMMDVNDIQGAGELVNLAHTVATLHRPPASQKKREEWGIGGPGSLGDKCSALLKVWKQRGEWNRVGLQELAYLPKSRQWALHPDHGPRRFLPDPLYPELGIDLMGQQNPIDDKNFASQFDFK